MLHAFDDRRTSYQSIFSDDAFSGGTPTHTTPTTHADAGMTPVGWALAHGPIAGYSGYDEPKQSITIVYRYCECGTRISRYNQGPRCYACDDARVDA